jgi:3-(3-hydroxy-phenyl)propionate hydroxylase
VNLQQYYVEEYLLDRARAFPDLIDVRFLSKVTGHEDLGEGVRLTVETPEGAYTLAADYMLACDGANSPTRARMGLDFSGRTFEERFLICDIEMEDSPFGDRDTPERWFWFDPPFHPGKSALLHKQPDNIYRIDLQLDADADPDAEVAEDRVLPRIRAIVGDKPFRMDWLSVYRFRCMMLERFVHGRVIFVGDSAHVVSPFGARGGNGGIQDVDNLGWKLAAVLQGEAPGALLDSYDEERRHGAAENILNSSRATGFMTPKSPVEALFRSETLRMAHDQPFARELINSGRLSKPCSLAGFPLQTDSKAGHVRPGTAMLDAPVGDTWLISLVQGAFTLVGFGGVHLPEVPGHPPDRYRAAGGALPLLRRHFGPRAGPLRDGAGLPVPSGRPCRRRVLDPDRGGRDGGPRPCARPQARNVGGRLMTRRSIHASASPGAGTTSTQHFWRPMTG